MNIKKGAKNEKTIKRVMPLLLILVLGASNSIYAETKEVTSDGITSETIVEGLSVFSGEADDIMVGRHYTEKVEIEKDRRSNEYVYPAGQNSTNATKRAFCYSEKHYIVYQRRVGNSPYKRKLYDEYHTTWKGQWRKKIDNSYSEWFDHPDYPKQSEVSRERSPLLTILSIMGA
ncbi:hypothetical protein [Emergencia sp. 1XD21-10]|uniref:hypothetical protein n=1 Tax=Emergencia sp. 1XD21-10 TaxID=2304569 RepID=UPI001379A0B6|nr:hypothetical protein [Emergencia sp. 1XD21-10]